MTLGLFAIGISHRSAQLSLREQLAFVPEEMADALRAGATDAGLDQLVILSTCNRTELYGIADLDDPSAPGRTLQWLAAYRQVDQQSLASSLYEYRGRAALTHIIRVASGLDSMALGEAQIFGQLKSAFAVASEAGTVGNEMLRLFSHVFAVAKRVRSETTIGENAQSVAAAAVAMGLRAVAGTDSCRALLLGAGSNIERVAAELRRRGCQQLRIASRTLERAQRLAEQYGAESLLFADVPAVLADVDLVISSTASQLPILGKGTVEQAMAGRVGRPLVLVDIAVPRDIEPQVAGIAGVTLYTLEELKAWLASNREARSPTLYQADAIIAEAVEAFSRQLRSRDVVATLTAFRQKIDDMREAELRRALRALENGMPASQVLELLSRSLTNKLLHQPSVQMKKASAAGRQDIIEVSRTLFDLDIDEDGL